MCVLQINRTAAAYTIGVGIADVTGPAAEITFVSTTFLARPFAALF